MNVSSTCSVKISIVMPVFNAASFLSKAINSVLEQKHRNLELIIIDDGSTDNSYKVSQTFSELDPRVKLIQISNSGPAKARNEGISICTGQFLFFLDADDYLPKNTLSDLLKAYEHSHADLVVSDFNIIENHSSQPSLNFERFPEDELLTKSAIRDYVLRYLDAPNRNPLFACSWGKLFHRDIIKKYKITFNDELRTFEDVAFNFDYLLHCSKIYFVNTPLYNHLVHDGFSSATMAIGQDPEKLYDFSSAIFKIQTYLQYISPEKDFTSEIGQAITSLAVIQTIRMCGQLNKSNFWAIYKAINKFVSRPEIKSSFQHYTPAKGNSVLIPYTLRYGLIFVSMLAAKYRASKRYNKENKAIALNTSFSPDSTTVLSKVEISDDLPIIIFGASTVGEVLYHFLTENGIQVSAFTENQVHKADKLFCGIEVLHTSKLQAHYNDAHFIISAADIDDVVHQLKGYGYNKFYAGGMLIQDIDLSEKTYSLPIEFVEFAVSASVTCHESHLSPEKISLRSVDIMVTEKCSLKCTDCSNLMQYFESPQNYSLDDLMNSVDNLCSNVDQIHEFRVIGGEPFMNKNVYDVIERLSHISNVKRVVIYTNGTIPLKQDSLGILQNEKVVLMITSYGDLSRNLDRIESTCDENNITYYTRPAQGWTDCAKLTKHNRTPEEHTEVFQSCCAKGLYTISEGELHRCPFSANAARLGAIPDYKNDYIDLLDSGEVNKDKLKNYLSNNTPLEACDYCTGRRLDDEQITPGIQTKVVLDYTNVRALDTQY